MMNKKKEEKDESIWIAFIRSFIHLILFIYEFDAFMAVCI